MVRKVGEDAILMPLGYGSSEPPCVFRLNPVGAFLWDQIDGQRTVTELASAVCDEFAATLTEVENDVCQFLCQLENIGAARMLEEPRPYKGSCDGL